MKESTLSINIARETGQKHSNIKQCVNQVIETLNHGYPGFVATNFRRETVTNGKEETISVIRVFRPAYPFILGKFRKREIRWLMENYY